MNIKTVGELRAALASLDDSAPIVTDVDGESLAMVNVTEPDEFGVVTVNVA